MLRKNGVLLIGAVVMSLMLSGCGFVQRSDDTQSLAVWDEYQNMDKETAR